MNKKTEPAPATRVRPVLRSGAFRQNGADYVRTYHHIVVPVDHTVDDILRPGYWAHHPDKFRVFDLVDVLTEDGNIDMQLRVVRKSVGMVVMRPVRIWQADEKPKTEPAPADEPDMEVPEGYEVNHVPAHKWRVMTKNPSQIVSKGHGSKNEAIRAAVAHFNQANSVAA